MTMDVTIRGAGIFGLAVAHACARRGARVRVIDPAGPGAGASGNPVGALAPHVPEQWNDKKAFQLESLLMAADYWDGVAGLTGRDPGYLRSGRLQPLADAQAVARARAREAEASELWQGRAEWRVVPAPAGWAPESPAGLVVRDTLAARIDPRRACAALAAAVTAQGGEVVAEGREQGAVVHATGWRGLVEMSGQAGREVGGGVKGQAARLAYDARDMPQIFAAGLLVVPHADGTVGVGSTSERDFDAPGTTDALLDEVVARARAVVPALARAAVLGRWAGVRPRSRTLAPMLGRHPFREGEYIANGGFKIGFGMAPLAGEAMAELVLEGRDGRIPAGFRPEASL